MLRSRFLPTLFSAGLLLAVACSDAVAPKTQSASTPTTQPQDAMVTLSGTLHLSGIDLYPVILTTSDGQDIPLAGAGANLLVSVANAGVDVRGDWIGDGAFLVRDFLVRTVDGGPVIDGVLIALFDTPIDDVETVGYALRPTGGGPIIKLIDPPADLLNHVNERVWVAGIGGGTGATSFGVIAEM
jgi:hypothetical protein